MKTLLLLLLPVLALCQTSRNLSLSAGFPLINERLPEGSHYLPFQLLASTNLTDLLKNGKSDLFVYLEPQLVVAVTTPDHKKNWEGGINLGLEYFYPLNANTAVCAAIGTGPHFLGLRTAMQARGFIFSDNFSAGIRHRIGQSGTSLDFKCRFRHISNANLQKPNLGIDNWFLMAGITRPL
jgi:hypothetical protein